MTTEPRFFIDHGVIHDRLTGKHVTTEPDTIFCDGVEHACELLNALSERRETRPIKLHFSNDWLQEKITSDPDIETDNR